MPLTPDEVRAIMDRHRWQPGEREAALAEVAERKAEREMGEAEQPHADVVIRKQRPIETAQPQAARMSSTTAWEAWVNARIKSQLDKRERLMADCVGEVLNIAPRRKCAALLMICRRG